RERVVFDAHGTRVAEREKRVDTVGDARTTLAVHAGDVRAGLFDVLQVHVEEAARQLVDRPHWVISLRRPPAGVDSRAEDVRLGADRSEDLARGPLRVVLEPEADA